MKDGQGRIHIPASARKDTCRGCGGTIYFVRTEEGRWMPTDPDGKSHFSTCSHAAFFRQPPEPERDPLLEQHAEELEERIGILYYEGGLPLPDAEEKAEEIIREKYPEYSQGSLF